MSPVLWTLFVDNITRFFPSLSNFLTVHDVSGLMSFTGHATASSPIHLDTLSISFSSFSSLLHFTPLLQWMSILGPSGVRYHPFEWRLREMCGGQVAIETENGQRKSRSHRWNRSNRSTKLHPLHFAISFWARWSYKDSTPRQTDTFKLETCPVQTCFHHT